MSCHLCAFPWSLPMPPTYPTLPVFLLALEIAWGLLALQAGAGFWKRRKFYPFRGEEEEDINPFKNRGYPSSSSSSLRLKFIPQQISPQAVFPLAGLSATSVKLPTRGTPGPAPPVRRDHVRAAFPCPARALTSRIFVEFVHSRNSCLKYSIRPFPGVTHGCIFHQSRLY
jgi:hypothetical protein